MRLRAFLSHRREDEAPVAALRDELCVRGIGGWKDTEDLPVGERTRRRIRRVLRRETGGFVWWGTEKVLASRIVNKLEIPGALRRKRRNSHYPLVPLFVELQPGRDREKILKAVGRRRGARLLDLNGVVRAPDEQIEQFVQRAARRYASDAIRGLGPGAITAGFTAFRAPRPEQDLTFDWRSVFDPETRELADGRAARLLEALGQAREALQSQSEQPQLLIDLNLPLPLAYLVGYEWRITTGMRLNFVQRTGTTEVVVAGEGPITDPVAPPEVAASVIDGPVVVVVSTPWGITGASSEYARAIGATNTFTLAAPRLLTAPELRGLARTTAGVLKELSDAGVEKHLLVRGPASLAAIIGAGANATGSTVLPFWHRDRFVTGIQVG